MDALIDAGKWPGGYVRGVGYVMALVTKTAARSTIIPQSAQEAFERALTFAGTPYSSGGVSKDGIDCSGLICAAYGLKQRWTTSNGTPSGLTKVTLHSSGSSIINELQLGDVLVWRFKDRNGKPAGHTVLYVNGTRIFHAHGKKGTPTGYTSDLVNYWIHTYGTPNVYRKY
ncbi:MAG: NlpC/P60 family protein [Prevotellaceae bacterium]|nr:NlpC/P60 family protein [Prevotellaceae bacterium]